MRLIRQLTTVAAIELLQTRGSCNQEEKDWSRDTVNDYIKHGRSYFYDVVLNSKKEIMELIPIGCQNIQKSDNLFKSIRDNGYDINSYLFLRDLNQGENGYFYVENGKHRIEALRKLLSENEKPILVPAVIALKHPLNSTISL
ncbi:MAG: hypothetical protein HYW37_00550 [Candidatus Colwellbacteria bacterium]|nr:hypothetical protein [Candidatus Colwellbacteria bacterium]